MKTRIYNNYEQFTEREDKQTNGVSEAHAKEHIDYKYYNIYNKGCWNCEYCSNCTNCKDCKDCILCVGCLGCENLVAETR